MDTTSRTIFSVGLPPLPVLAEVLRPPDRAEDALLPDTVLLPTEVVLLPEAPPLPAEVLPLEVLPLLPAVLLPVLLPPEAPLLLLFDLFILSLLCVIHFPASCF